MLRMRSRTCLLALIVFAGLASFSAVASASTLATNQPNPLSGPAYPNATEAPRPANPSTSGTVQPQVNPLYFGQCAATANPLCMWQDANYGGLFWFRNESTSNKNQWYYVGNLWGTETPFNDRASSVYCRRVACGVSADWPPSNRIYCLPSQWVAGNLAEYVWQDGSSMNDSISSFNLQSKC
jgi:hypothetical protein